MPYPSVTPVGPALIEIEDERKFATVLFADIAHSTLRIAGAAPDDALELLRPALEAMAACITSYGGRVNRANGDGVMALFGAPAALEDHALAACCAAAAMQGDPALGSAGIALRIGIHSGDFVVHRLDMSGMTVLDAAGVTVHLAARLQQLAEPGETLISAATLRLAGSRARVEARGPQPLRGIAEPVEVHRLLTADAAMTRLDTAGRRKLTPLIGRETELGRMLGAFAAAAAGRGRALLLLGEAGIGKSRLMRDLAATLGSQVPILAASGVRWRAETTLYPMRQLLRAALGLPTELASVPTGEEEAAALRDVPEHEADAVRELLGLPTGEAWRRQQPSARRQALIAAAAAAVLRWGAGRPALVLLDDLQWADAETGEAIEALMARLADMPLLVILAARPEHELPVLRRSELETIPLAALAAADSQQLWRAVAPPGFEQASDAMVARCAGNPFFLEEAAAAPGDAAPSPDIRTMIGARLDRLAPPRKRLLEVVAAMDEPVGLALLAACADWPGDANGLLAEALALDAEGVLRAEGLAGATEVSCRHALLQDVAYGTLTARRRRQLHAAIAERLERFLGADAAANAELLARHSRLGERWEATLLHAERAARLALSRFANRAAVAFLDDAIAALDQLKLVAAHRTAAMDLRLLQREPLFRLGRTAALRTRLTETVALAHAAGDRARLAQARLFESHYACLVGDRDAGLEAVLRVEALAVEDDDAALALRARFQRGYWAMSFGHNAECAVAMEAVAAEAADPRHGGRFGLDAALVVVALGYRARALADLGDLAEAQRMVAACNAQAAVVGRPFSWIFARLAEAHVLTASGEAERAIPLVQEALQHCDKSETDLMRVVALTLLGAALLRAGRPAESVAAVEEAERLAAGMRFTTWGALRARMLEAGRAGAAGR